MANHIVLVGLGGEYGFLFRSINGSLPLEREENLDRDLPERSFVYCLFTPRGRSDLNPIEKL